MICQKFKIFRHSECFVNTWPYWAGDLKTLLLQFLAASFAVASLFLRHLVLSSAICVFHFSHKGILGSNLCIDTYTCIQLGVSIKTKYKDWYKLVLIVRWSYFWDYKAFSKCFTTTGKWTLFWYDLNFEGCRQVRFRCNGFTCFVKTQFSSKNCCHERGLNVI